jgi:putative phosphoribosyl transferase
MVFADRREAGRQLAAKLGQMNFERAVVLALPRGGVPVAVEVASALQVPLDLLFVRKIGLPWQSELAVGAVVDGAQPQMVLNDRVLAMVDVPQAYLDRERDRELAEIERRRAQYCGDHSPVDVGGRAVILVDDGVATGTTVRAALIALERLGAARQILAVPVIAPDTAAAFRADGIEVVALAEPENFRAVGEFYRDFHQLEDEEVVRLLAGAAWA